MVFTVYGFGFCSRVEILGLLGNSRVRGYTVIINYPYSCDSLSFLQYSYN